MRERPRGFKQSACGAGRGICPTVASKPPRHPSSLPGVEAFARTHMKATASIRIISTPALLRYSSSLAIARNTAGFE